MTKSAPRIAFRADASSRIGAGHIMRCIALAQAWQDCGGEAFFISHCESDALRERIFKEGFRVVAIEQAHPHAGDISQTLELVAEYVPAWLVLDGYHFDGAYQRGIKEAGLKLLVLDDYGHADHYWADIVLNQNVGASDTLYAKRETYTRLLTGCRYALLRKEFRQWKGHVRRIPEKAKKLLVTMGGGDPDNVTLKVVEALKTSGLEELDTTVVVGGTNAQADALGALQCANLHFVKNASNMPELIASADLAVSAGGSTSWEMAFLGLPAAIVVLADNQRQVAERLHDLGVAVNLGEHSLVSGDRIAGCVKGLMSDPTRRAVMSEKGRELVDGEGAARVVMQLRGDRFRLRKARPADAEDIWELANDPAVRVQSFSTDPIAWQTHQRWFAARLGSPCCHYFLAVDADDNMVGQVRFDDATEMVVINVSVAGPWRSCGIGTALISSAVDRLFAQTRIREVHALIKCDNQPSIRAFEKAGFHRAEDMHIQGSAARHYICRRGKVYAA